MIALVNWQQEEPNGCGGGQQLLMNGTSRVNREIYARFCERLGVKFPGPTRRYRATDIPTATGQRFSNRGHFLCTIRKWRPRLMNLIWPRRYHCLVPGKIIKTRPSPIR